MDARERYWWQRSLRYKLIASVLLMAMPLVGMLLYNNFYAIHTVRGQVADSYKNMLNLYMSQIDSDLNDMDAYMNTVAGSGFDLASLSWAVTDTDYYSAKIYLYNKLAKDIALYQSLDSFFVYVGQRSEFMEVSRQDSSYEEKEQIQSHLVDLIQTGQIPKGVSTKRWSYVRIEQNVYLIDMIQIGDVVLGGLIRSDDLLKPLQALEIGDEGSILLANKLGEPITDVNWDRNSGIQLNTNLNDFYMSGTNMKFLVVGTSSTKGNFNLVALIPDHYILDNLPYLQGIVWFITIASLLFIPVGLYLMRQAVLVPLNRVLFTMKMVRHGDWNSRVDMKDKTDEFQLLGESFNSMMSEIQTLRMNVYEEQLNKQREELQRLQLQVNPHFYLNTLNIVYNLAKVKKYELILEMTMSLIHYFRFMFRSNTSFVKLKDELEHTRNYLRIQTLRFPEQLTWSVEAPNFLLDTPIPPLIIQSFVENSIKHAVTMDQPIHISVWIDFLDEEKDSQLKISIRDTGCGFRDEVLRELETGRSIQNDRGENTGIWNVQRRLGLLYGDKVSIRYYNVKGNGGAAVDLILPTNQMMEET